MIRFFGIQIGNNESNHSNFSPKKLYFSIEKFVFSNYGKNAYHFGNFLSKILFFFTPKIRSLKDKSVVKGFTPAYQKVESNLDVVNRSLLLADVEAYGFPTDFLQLIQNILQ